MDEITLVNLLNKICDKSTHLAWKLNCKYPDENNASIMQVNLFNQHNREELTSITFHMENGRIIQGRHRELVQFVKSTDLTDALLDILIYENQLQYLPGN